MSLLDFTSDPASAAQLGLIGSLFSTRKGQDIGAPLLNYAGVQMKMAADERANRANDLQQVMGLYSTLRNQEFQRAANAKAQGIPYTENPMIGQLEQRIGQLVNVGNVNASAQPASPISTSRPQDMIPGSQMPPMPQIPQGPQMSTPQNPRFDVPPPQSSPQQPMASASPNPEDHFGEPAGGMTMQQWAVIDPSGKSYAAALQKEYAPISTRYGIFQKQKAGVYNPVGGALPQNAMPYLNGPNGPSVGPLPGQLETQAAQTYAGASGKFPFTNVRTGSGAEMPAYLAGLTPPPNPFSPGSPQPQAQRPPVIGAPPAPQSPRPAASNDPYTGIPTIPQPGGVGQSTQAEQMSKLYADANAAKAKELSDLANSGNKRLAMNEQARETVDKADTGIGAALKTVVKNALVSNLGVSENLFDNTPTNNNILDKTLTGLAIERLKTGFGSRPAQSEFQALLNRGAPAQEMMKGAIKYLLATDDAMAQYDINKANYFGGYYTRNGDPMRFEGEYAKRFPLTPVIQAAHPQTPAQAPAPTAARARTYNPTTGRIE